MPARPRSTRGKAGMMKEDLYKYFGSLQDWNITRNIDWGIKFPGDESLVLYVWFDAPIGYIQSTEEWAMRTGGDWMHYWKGPGKLIHFIGPALPGQQPGEVDAVFVHISHNRLIAVAVPEHMLMRVNDHSDPLT